IRSGSASALRSTRVLTPVVESRVPPARSSRSVCLVVVHAQTWCGSIICAYNFPMRFMDANYHNYSLDALQSPAARLRRRSYRLGEVGMTPERVISYTMEVGPTTSLPPTNTLKIIPLGVYERGIWR